MENNQAPLLAAEKAQLSELEKIVQQAIDEENSIIYTLKNPIAEILTKGQSISDKVARFGGSWKFIILFSTILFCWIVFNALSPKGIAFDPYPFILMNLVLSAIAALQAPIIMMSQNRKEENDRKRSENDYLINLKAELEIRSLHKKIDLLLIEQFKTLIESQAEQLTMLNNLQGKVDDIIKNRKGN